MENLVKKYGRLQDGEYYVYKYEVEELAAPIWENLIDIKPRFKNVFKD